jgi:SAM-dependent methyltransferase
MSDTSKLFNDKSDLYAQARPQYPAELFAFIKTLIPNANTVWDCATGNGQAAVGLSKVFDHVYATDISDEQIANHLRLDNVAFSVSPAERTVFANNMFDLVSVAQALHWFDFNKFWPEVQRVLKPGGAFITYAYSWFAITPQIDALVESEVKAVIAPYWAAQNQLVIDGYKDVEFPFEKAEVPKINLQIRWNFSQFMNYLHTWSATRRCMDDKGETFFEHAQDKLKKSWGDPTEIKTATAPLTIVAGYLGISG